MRFSAASAMAAARGPPSPILPAPPGPRRPSAGDRHARAAAGLVERGLGGRAAVDAVEVGEVGLRADAHLVHGVVVHAADEAERPMAMGALDGRACAAGLVLGSCATWAAAVESLLAAARRTIGNTRSVLPREPFRAGLAGQPAS